MFITSSFFGLQSFRYSGNAIMGSSIPHFKHRAKDPANRHLGFIELDGFEKYWIDDLEDFYRAMGFHNDMRKLGVMPDEFVWDEYYKYPTANKSALYQFHILEYLMKHSSEFNVKYSSQYRNWLSSYEAEFGAYQRMLLS